MKDQLVLFLVYNMNYTNIFLKLGEATVNLLEISNLNIKEIEMVNERGEYVANIRINISPIEIASKPNNTLDMRQKSYTDNTSVTMPNQHSTTNSIGMCLV